MAYVKQVWIDDDESSPISAARLNYIEQGIFNAAAKQVTVPVLPSTAPPVAPGHSRRRTYNGTT